MSSRGVRQSVFVSFTWKSTHLCFDIKGSWRRISFSPIHLFLRCVGTALIEDNHQENSTKVYEKKESKIFKLMTCSLPFSYRITRSPKRWFSSLFHKVFSKPCCGTATLLRAWKQLSLFCCELPLCKALQGSAWPPAPAQPRLLNQVSNQQGTLSYHNAHESQLFSLSTSWAAIAQLSLFLKKPGPWMGWVESGGSWEERRWVSRERKALWGGSTNSSKSLPPMLCCLAVAFVKPTGSYLFLKPTGSWLPQWPWEVWTPCHCLWQTNSNSSRSTH